MTTLLVRNRTWWKVQRSVFLFSSQQRVNVPTNKLYILHKATAPPYPYGRPVTLFVACCIDDPIPLSFIEVLFLGSKGWYYGSPWGSEIKQIWKLLNDCQKSKKNSKLTAFLVLVFVECWREIWHVKMQLDISTIKEHEATDPPINHATLTSPIFPKAPSKRITSLAAYWLTQATIYQ